MELDIYQVDAFSDRVFAGNPAAVVPLEEWMPDDVLQAIAVENNLSETAFFVSDGGRYQLRWFTPTREVDLCGHATLASAYVIFRHLDPGATALEFESASGLLRVTKNGDFLWLDFPSRPATAWDDGGAVGEALGAEPREILRTSLANPESDKIVAIFDDADAVRALRPDFMALMQLEGQGVVATAPGDAGIDFVSRYFVPKVGVPEDPVTGSTHTTLTPLWSERLQKDELSARQLSQRGGELRLRLQGDRVLIGGQAVLYLQGRISI